MLIHHLNYLNITVEMSLFASLFKLTSVVIQKWRLCDKINTEEETGTSKTPQFQTVSGGVVIPSNLTGK